MEPSSQCLAAAPLILNCPVLLAGAQIRRLVQDRSPAGRHHEDPGQLAASPAGAFEQGAANQVRLLGESAVVLGGQASNEHGGDPEKRPRRLRPECSHRTRTRPD